MMDIARIVGVSQSSVSLVLNEMSGARISADTRNRVRQVAREIGYALPIERRKQSNESMPDKIAFIIDEISTSPHPVVSLDAARDFAFEQGMIVASHSTRSNQSLKDATLKSILGDKSIAGIIYATVFTRKVNLPPELENIPTVLLNCYGEERKYVSVVPGEISGSFTATSHLTELGHKRIGFINGEPWMDASIDRLKGYKQALSTADIAFDENLVRDGDWLPLRGYQATLELLALDRPPTAIFCGNDLMAIGALNAASEHGFKVPEDISIMGYDNQELARYTRPLLTTLELPNFEMGQRAAEFLIDIAIHNKVIKPMIIKLDGPLVVRESTAPPKKH
jgi:LacI family transcriptional regulator